MIQKHRFAAPLEARCLETWPWPIKIYTLGRFEVLINGQPLGKNHKTPHRLMELLIAIMTYGGAPVSAARLMDMLWPGGGWGSGTENLKKSIARLRQLLAVDDALCWQDGEISLNRTCCWVDAWAFEASLGEGESKRTTGTVLQDGHRDNIIALYRGPFLGWNEIAPWADSYRERIRRQFTRLFTHREKVVDGMQCKGTHGRVGPEPLTSTQSRNHSINSSFRSLSPQINMPRPLPITTGAEQNWLAGPATVSPQNCRSSLKLFAHGNT